MSAVLRGNLLVLVPAMAMLVCLATAAQARPAVTMEDVLDARLVNVSHLVWSGDSSALMATWAEPEAEEKLVAWNLDGGAQRMLGEGRFAAPSPDGRWLVYLEGRRWQLRELGTGTTTPIGEEAPHPLQAHVPPTWSRDSRQVAIVDTLRPAPAPFEVEPSVEDGVRVIDVGRVADGPARDNQRLPRVLIVDVDEPRQPSPVALTESHIYYGEWGPGDDFYVVAMQMSYWTGERPYTALKRVETSTMRVSEVYRLDGGIVQGAKPSVSPDGGSVALALDIDTGQWDDYPSLVLIDARSGESRRLTTDHYVTGRYVWAHDGKALYFVSRFGGLDQIHRIDIDGKEERIGDGERRHHDLGLSPDGRWLSYQTEDGYGRKDVRVRLIASGEERIVAVLSDPARDFRLGLFRHVKWRSTDGLEIFGYVFLPPDFDPGRKYPMYVDVHGGGPGARLYLFGPLSIHVARTPLEWHALAALGYVVFVPDMRSSGEYGPHVAAARYAAGGWDRSGIVKDTEDVESGTRWMIEQGYVDPKRIAVLGHSAGGGRVNYLLTRSRLYGAGIIHDPIEAGGLPGTILRMSGRNTGTGFDENYASFADDPSVFTGGFLFDGYKSTTPTLIMVGNPDKGGIGTLSSEVLFSMLRQYDVPARMLRYVDDGHFAVTADAVLHRYREVVRWLETHVPPG